jgi:penicillin-binding protein 2
MGYDLPTGKRGNVPTSKTYKKDLLMADGGNNCIKCYRTRRSIDDTIQLANMMATVANEGHYYTPHIIKRLKVKASILPKVKHETTIDSILNQ